MSIRHIILWKLKDELSGGEKMEICAGIKQGLEELVGKIPGLLSVKVIYEGKLPGSSADLMLDSVFSEKAALLAYQKNPLHVAVAEAKVRPYVKVRLCLDLDI